MQYQYWFSSEGCEYPNYTEFEYFQVRRAGHSAPPRLSQRASISLTAESKCYLVQRSARAEKIYSIWYLQILDNAILGDIEPRYPDAADEYVAALPSNTQWAATTRG